MIINKTRLKEIKKLVSGVGDLERGLCVMQAVDYVTTGGLTDRPSCACPVLTRYAIKLNDSVGAELRQKLKPLITKLVGTRDGESKRRAEFIVHRQLTVTMPIFLRAIGLKAEAKEAASFKPGQFVELKEFYNRIKPAMVKAARSNAAAAYAAASAAAYAAYAADAYAYAAAAYAAYAADAADAADAAGKKAARVRKSIHLSSIKTLGLACKIRPKKVRVK